MVYPHQICIQGTNTNNILKKWQFYDGSEMTFFKWALNQPKGEGYIRMYRNQNYEWLVTPLEANYLTTFLCEYRKV